MLEEEDYDEIDCSIFTQRSNLDGTCMDDDKSALKRFDRSCSSPTSREQLFQAYVTTKKEIRNDLSKLGGSDEYGRAKDARNMMSRMRHECGTLEAAATKAKQNSQCTYLDKANRKIITELNRKHQLQAEAMKERNRCIEEEHRMTNEIEWENLNHILSRIPRPRVRFSKRVVQLLDAENGLIKHGQYDDAQRVRHMLDKLIPSEELKFYADFDAGIEAKRERLRTLQVQ
jgi:hypothetical protein